MTFSDVSESADRLYPGLEYVPVNTGTTYSRVICI